MNRFLRVNKKSRRHQGVESTCSPPEPIPFSEMTHQQVLEELRILLDLATTSHRDASSAARFCQFVQKDVRRVA